LESFEEIKSELGYAIEYIKLERERIISIIPLIKEELEHLKVENQEKAESTPAIEDPIQKVDQDQKIHETIGKNIKKNYERFRSRKLGPKSRKS